MAKIKVIPDDSIEALLPAKTLIRVEATAIDGARHAVEIINPLGHPDNPMEDRHIEEKFFAMVKPVLGKARCRAALDRWWKVQETEDVSALIRLLDINKTAE